MSHSLRIEPAKSVGCRSKMGTQNGTLVNGNMDENLWVPGGSILTHTQFAPSEQLYRRSMAQRILLDGLSGPSRDRPPQMVVYSPAVSSPQFTVRATRKLARIKP